MADNPQNRWNPGMNSDAEPQPTRDPDFGPGLEYESGDRNRDFSEADKIREQWRQREQTDNIDPVCRMRVEEKTLGSNHGGRSYFFCSQQCKQAFDLDPDRYLADAA